MLINKSEHTNITYIEGHHNARLAANETLFKSMQELEEGVYEVQKAKRRIVLSVPTQIGFFILQYAKMRMLEFKYDFLLTYFD